MYHILVETNLFCQDPGYLSAHFESFEGTQTFHKFYN